MRRVTSLSLRNANPAKTKADAVVVGVVQRTAQPKGRRKATTPPGKPEVELAPGGEEVASAYGRKLAPLLAALGVTGAPGETVKVPTGGALGTPLLVLVGLGKEPGPDAVRRAAGAAARVVTNAATVALALPADSPELLRAVTEGWLLGGYRFADYLRDTASDSTEAGEVVVCSPIARRKEATAALEQAQVVAEAVAGARRWVDTPPGDLTPPTFADAVVEAAGDLASGRKPTVSITVHDELALEEMGCGGLIGVGRGSDAPPRLVELTYDPKGATTHVSLVGKGITFDSGGLSIKPAGSMKEMKSDMAGAAAVAQATFAIARLGLPVKVTTFLPLAENMINGHATRPGDVLRIYGGTTVEVTNTDAEGRLVLADAMVRAGEGDPDVLVDVATLTGAMVVALGDKVAGVMGTEAVVEAVLAAGSSAGEALWPMPIPEEMKQRVTSSKIADLAQHDAVRWGGGLFAGAFLREFTDGRPWAHVDIAGPSYNSGGPAGHVTTGGTGFGVATLVDYVRGLAG